MSFNDSAAGAVSGGGIYRREAYIARSVYEDLAENGSNFMSVKYVMRTRTPVDDIYELMREHKMRLKTSMCIFRSRPRAFACGKDSRSCRA